jgi:pimeloyl-CoA dehydrogenase small subunit
MDFNFTEEQSQLRNTLQKLLADQYDFDSRRKVLRSETGWRPELWAQFAELGLLMAPFSEADGGLGGGPVDAMVVMEEFGRALVVEPYLQTVVLAGGLLKHAGTTAQKEEHLAAILGGATVFAFAHAEPQSRYDLFDVQTQARKQGAGYVLNGHKAVVIGAPWADWLIVSARTAGGRRDARGISLFIVPKSAKGVTTRDYPTVDGARASELYLENVEVPADHMIGEIDEALPLIEKVNDEAIAALCAEATGAMRALHEATVGYARQRKQFGTSIASFQVIQHRMVDMFMAAELATSSTFMVTLRLDDSPVERMKAASSAKVQIGKSARLIGQDAVQIHGGMGMTDELNVGHYFKRLSIIESQFGNSDWHMRRYVALSASEHAKAA